MYRSLQIFAFLNLLFFSLAMSKVDLKEKRLPNSLMFPAILIAYLILIFQGLIVENIDIFTRDLIPLIVLVLGFLVVALIVPNGFGMGDVKGMLFLGISISSLGFQTLIFSVFLSFISASSYALFIKIAKKVDLKEFAFGPFLFIPGLLILALNTFWI